MRDCHVGAVLNRTSYFRLTNKQSGSIKNILTAVVPSFPSLLLVVKCHVNMYVNTYQALGCAIGFNDLYGYILVL